MKKTLVVLGVIAAALGIGFVSGAAPGCCLIPQASAATAAGEVTTLHIDGMTCGSCATAVKRVLKKVNGVKDAQVSFQEKKGVVTYDPSKVTPAQVAQAITEKLPTYKATVIK